MSSSSSQQQRAVSLEDLRTQVLKNCGKRVPQQCDGFTLADSLMTSTQQLASLVDASPRNKSVRKACLSRNAAAALVDALKVALTANVCLNELDGVGLPNITVNVFATPSLSLRPPPGGGEPSSDATNNNMMMSGSPLSALFQEIKRTPPSARGSATAAGHGKPTTATIDDIQNQQRDGANSSDADAEMETTSLCDGVSLTGGVASTSGLQGHAGGSFIGGSFQLEDTIAGMNINMVNSIPCSVAASPLEPALPPTAGGGTSAVGATAMGGNSFGNQYYPLGAGVPVGASSGGGGGGGVGGSLILGGGTAAAGGGAVGGSAASALAISGSMRTNAYGPSHQRTASGVQRIETFENVWTHSPDTTSSLLLERLNKLIASGVANDDLIGTVNAEITAIDSFSTTAGRISVDAVRDCFLRADKVLCTAERRGRRSSKPTGD